MMNRSPKRQKIVDLYNAGKGPMEIADEVGKDVGNVNNMIYRARKTGEITRHVYNKKQKVRPENPGHLYRRHKVRTGWIWDITREMSDDVLQHYIDACINGKYENLAECFADILIDKYFEDKQNDA